MKKIFTLIVALIVVISCKNDTIEYQSFGDKIASENPMKVRAITEQYNAMKLNDSINTKLIAKVDEVCQAKGCWMKLNLEDGNQVMVRFKDYGFFVPKDIAGKKVILEGKAFVAEVSVEEQRHYAEDAGKSSEEIAKINEPKRTYSFEAHGVLLKGE